MRKILLLCFFLFSAFLHAQVYETSPPDYIKTIEFKGGIEFSGTPIVALGEPIQLEFDDLIGDEADYYYTIEHYNFDWTPSGLAQSEFMDGYDDTRIRNYENSFNTLQIFSHYRLNIPNVYTRALKVSGNYLLKVFNNNKELVFSRKFIVFEDLAIVRAEIKRSRDLKFIKTKQVVNFSIDGAENIIFRNPDRNLNTLILKNNNLKNGIYNLKPQYNLGSKLIYKYDQKAAFWAGNEYLNFDTKDVRASSMNIQRIELIDIYNTYLFPDAIRAFDPYTYYPDINGNFTVRTLQGEKATIEAEYTWVHFALENYEKLDGGEIHLYGKFNNFTLDESTKLTYNPTTKLYETKRLFKQGFYNYKYVLLRPDGSIDEGFFSGNFEETENQYTILAYYREVGGRYDRVIGAGSANSRNISN